jgi:hypothetical protein
MKARGLSNPAAGFLGNPFSLAVIEARFLYSDIDPKAKTTVILIRDQRESRFGVDFSMYK